MRKTSSVALPCQIQFSDINSYPGFPIDISAVPFIRCAVYIPAEVRSSLVRFAFQIFSPPFNGSDYRFSEWRVGWNEFKADIANPDAEIGIGPADLNDIVTLQVELFFGNIADVMEFEQFIVDRFYYTPRDLGSDVAPGV